MTFLVLPAENFREQRNIWKGSPVFPDGIFQTEIRVLFLQSHLWYQFPYEGWFPPIFKFRYAIPFMLFSFLRNSLMQFRILLFSFEFFYSLFWFYFAIMPSLINSVPILLFAFEFCYAIFQFYNSIVQSSHAVSNPIIPLKFRHSLFQFFNAIMNFLFSFQFYYSLSNKVFPNPGLCLFGRRCPGDQ